MAKFPLLVFIVSVAIGLHNVAESLDIAQTDDKVDDKPDDTSAADANDDRRSGAYAYASMSVSKQSNYGPTPLLVSPPTVGRTSPSSYGYVECYSCINCPKILPNTTTKWCPKIPGIRSACVSYAEKFRYLKNTFYIRGCASERGSCADIRETHKNHKDIVKLLYCDECEGNRCNTSGAERTFVDLTLAIITLLVTPLVAKCTLS